MRERSFSGQEIEPKDFKKIRLNFDTPEQPCVGVDRLWHILSTQFERILRLKTVEAMRIAEEVRGLSNHRWSRPKLMEETDNLLSNFCAEIHQTLSQETNPITLLINYSKCWRNFLLSIEDINTILKVFHIQGIVKRGLQSWWNQIFVTLGPRIDPIMIANKIEVNEDISPMNTNDREDVFAPYYSEFQHIFNIGNALSSVFQIQETEEEDDDLFFIQTTKMKIPTVQLEEASPELFANTSQLPSELVFEIFTFLSSESELIAAGQVCR
eukprot:TRINITY_DN1703_c0_g1_i2.p1 TRINITY_DN1703_c0_g1~~TRINITY_DN1703_c0_g1_i2.p1  ORF type:complete len:269 (-),score=48.87 TRINITY_DN1703_c0_g1_i2:316-1122(-)